MPVGVPTPAIRPVFPPWQGYTALWIYASASSEATRREDRGAAQNAARPSHRPISPLAIASYIMHLLLALVHPLAAYDADATPHLPQYPSTLCPPPHYTVPLLPWRSTVPTLHGCFPVHALEDPGSGGDTEEVKEETEADAGQWIIGEEGDSDRLQDQDRQLEETARRSPRTSRPCPRHARTRSLRRSRSTARSPRSTCSISAHPPLPRPFARHSRSSSARPSSRAYPASSSPRSSSRSPRSPHVSSPPSSPALLLDLWLGPHKPFNPLKPCKAETFTPDEAGGRLGAPPFLARDRREAGERWVPGGGTGPQPRSEAIHEKNTRLVVRFEVQLPAYPTHAWPPVDSDSARRCDERDFCVDELGGALDGGGRHRARRAVRCRGPRCGRGDARRLGRGRAVGRARLCTGYTARAPVSREVSSSGAGGGAVGNSGGGKKGGEEREERAQPGRIGRVYELGSFSGLWAGPCWYVSLATASVSFHLLPSSTSRLLSLVVLFPPPDASRTLAAGRSLSPFAIIPSEPHDTALVTAPGGAFTPGGLERGAPGVICASRMRGDGARNGSLEAQFGYAGGEGGYGAAFGAGGLEARGGRVDAYVYETVGEGRRVREGAHAEGCPGCAGAEERARWRRAGGDAEMREELLGRETSSGLRLGIVASGFLVAFFVARTFVVPSSTRLFRRAFPILASTDLVPRPDHRTTRYDDAPLWAGHRFADDEGWEACDGLHDVVFTGATNPRHGMAWQHYEYAGRVRPWDGLIGLVVRPVGVFSPSSFPSHLLLAQ
ncbi:hypothetical protein B0H15DRAFT_954731 [Mycena belliarum]|uniref:Uncharacterized protein n=1 Tax=Mycena belliarum TaxID=1033014 RepID=A0AAD6TTZ9_9AGAR|nr:hypothetical protein B0H15DRAFT_954731 [Mycena belliae]